jgi:hypothetical protein
MVLIDKGDGTFPPKTTVDPATAPMPVVTAWAVADALWDMYTSRDSTKRVVGDMAALSA